MIALAFSRGIWLGIGIYALLLVITVAHIAGSHRAPWDKTIAVLGVVLLPVGGMLDWWWRVVWGSRAEQLARRNRTRKDHLVDKREEEQ